jgi:dethiobiotin synthetase
MTDPTGPTYLLVTGTSTGVGKTVATAAIAVALSDTGLLVRVVKPVQTGAGGDEPADVGVVRRLTGLADVDELASLPDPLAPDTAARLRGTSTPTVGELADRIAADSGGPPAADVVLIEGSGGVLVRLDTDGGTLLDLGDALKRRGAAVSALVVTTLALGTLNHTELTLMAMRSAGLPAAGLVIGSRPSTLGLAEECNLTELERVGGAPMLGELPAGAGALSPAAFRSAAPSWFAPGLAESVVAGLAQR